ncbi:MAG: hypothetical protein ACREI5_05045 [Candidatus Methylomirabilales bacterium]
MDADSVYNKWNDWLSTIYSDIQGVLINRHIFREVQQIIRANPKIQIDSSFFEWMVNVYAAAAVIGVRRQLDEDQDSISFARLLGEIMASPKVLSRERFVALYKGSVIPNKYAHHDFDKFSGPGGSYVDPVPVQADLSTLRQKAARIRKYANKRIAHFDKSDFKHLPTYADLDESLDYLEALLKKYLLLFRAEGHGSIVPVWQYDWKEIFRLPWIE